MASVPRDKALLDALERLPQAPWSGTAWRSVRQGRDPLDCARAGGRWDDRSLDVLYTSETRKGAIEERRFHLYRDQPIPPSKVRYELFELVVRLASAVRFDDLTALAAIGMATTSYGKASYADREAEYPRSQQIAEACFFLGADGIIVPNARHRSCNVVVFCEQDPAPHVEIVRSLGVLSWNAV